MKQLCEGDQADYNIASGAEASIYLDGVNSYWDSGGVAHHLRVLLNVGVGNTLTDGAELTLRVKIGSTAANLKTLITHTKVATADAQAVLMCTDEILLATVKDRVRVTLSSDQAGDTAVAVKTWTMDVLGQDAEARVDVGKILGTAVTLTNDQLDVNAAQAGGATPVTKADINTEVDAALVDINLDHLLKVAESGDVTTDSVIGKLASTNGNFANFVKATDSLQSLKDLLPAANVAALMAKTGITAGGTYTFEDLCKCIGAYLLGTWQDKAGDASIQQLLDWEDDATVIMELLASQTTPYKATTKQ